MAGGKFLAPETRQKLIGRLPGELHGSGQIAVERMRNLIGVVAETADLREQRRIHRAIFAGRHLDLALADKPLAQPRDRHPRLARVDAPAQVLILRQPDGHGPVARCAGMGTSSGHLIRLIRLGFGSREPRPDRRGPGECGCTLPGERDLKTIATSVVQSFSNPHLATPLQTLNASFQSFQQAGFI